ncbi:hypothetical protein [Ilumatobacter sp.]|uniref:hypothetical protein n=1 Tax=Ilumatobacter sp. TaxID=1967498 RepID=UPI003AF644AA
MSKIRTRWAAIGAVVAITLGGGGVGLVRATQPDGASTLVPITPCRVIDTRPEFNVGPKASPLGPGETHSVSAHGDNGDCTGIPADAVALSMNVTAVDATAPTFLTIWATGESQPTASSLNPTPGQPPAPNAVTTDLSAGGQFDIFNLDGNVHVLADINGYYVDHHHDDRYYTQEEVDMLLADDGPTAWGRVTGGNLDSFSSSPNAVEALNPVTGRYCVVFDPPIPRERLRSAVVSPSGNNNAFVAENVTASGGADGCVDAPDQAGLQIDVFNTANNTRINGRFNFLVP